MIASMFVLRSLLVVASLAPLLPAQSVPELVREGRVLAGKKQFQQALAKLDAAVKAAPENVEARRWRGHCLTGLEDYAAALRDLEIAVRLEPRHSWTLYARAMAKHKLGRLAEALKDYTGAIALDASNFKAVEWRGYTHARLGDHLSAWVDYTRAMQLDPKNPWVYFVRAKSAMALGDLRWARKDFAKALVLDAKDADTHAQLGFIAVAMGEDKRALRHLEKAVELDARGQDYARLWRYWLRMKQGKTGRYPLYDLPERGWVGQLGKVLAGGLTTTGILQRVGMHGTDTTGFRTRQAEAYFYLGLRARLTGKATRARDHLKEALARGDQTMPEWHAARRLLR